MRILLVFLLLYLSSTTSGSVRCEWRSQPDYKLVPYTTYSSYVVTIYTVGSEAICQERCLQQTSFLCAAYNYNPSYRTCELLAETDQTAFTYYNTRWQYAVRPGCAGIWMPWKALKDATITTFSADRSSGSSEYKLRTCMSSCMQDTSSGGSDCRSVVASQGGGSSCDLISRRSDDREASTEFKPAVALFNRPFWYQDDSAGATNQAIQNYGFGDYLMALLTSYRIPVDGHLVAWKYYVGNAASPCTSYATVWRENTDRQYTRITETKLSPELPLSAEVKFQFVQNSTVLLRKDDFLGIYVDGNSSCIGNIISLSYQCGQRERVYDGDDIFHRPTVVSARQSQYKCLKVALKAYVAELIRIEDPKTTHNPSLYPRQIKLTWRQSIEQTNQYVPGTGYIKAECSTDYYFSTTINCLPDAVPLENLQNVLELPHVTQPYYARLYVVRNYNGEEVQQKISSSDFYYVNNRRRFCVEREISSADDVTFTEEGEIIPSKPITLLVAVDSAKDDSCIKRVRISYSGRTTLFKTDQSPWGIQVNQGKKVQISISYILVDGYEIPVWSGYYRARVAPGGPELLPVKERGSNSTKLSWNSPPTADGILSYQVTCYVTNSSYNSDVRVSPQSWNTSDATTHSMIVSPLLPQVQYRCAVRANIHNGYGASSGYKIFWTKPVELTLNFSEDKPKVFDGLVNISLPEVSHQPLMGYESMQLAVETLYINHKRELTNNDTEDSESYYITAQIPLSSMPEVFTVGDNQTFGGYVNTPLDIGSYQFYIGFKAATEVIVDFVLIPDSQVEIEPTTFPTEKTNPVSSRKGVSVGGVIGLVAFGVILVVAIVAILVVVVRRRRSTRNKNTNGLHSSISLTDLQPSHTQLEPNELLEESTAPLLSPEQVDDTVYANADSANSPSNEVPVSKLHQFIQEMKEADPSHPFKDEYKDIGHPKLSCATGCKAENANKNRFKNIIAADYSRVVLRVNGENASDTDYVNANYIQGSNSRRYIACQGPIDSTIEDMWRLIHDTNSSIVVMLTDPIESCKKKCSVYYVDSTQTSDLSVIFGRFEIKLVEEQKFAEYIVRKLCYTYNQMSRTVKQFHFTQWPDHGVPTTSGLLNFRHRVKLEMATKKNPVIVHCSAGVGRTGTFIGLNLLIDKVNSQTDGAEATVDVMKCVYEMRCQRSKIIQTAEQYTFLYEVLAEALTCGDTSVPCASFDESLEHLRQRRTGEKCILQEQFDRSRITCANITVDSHMTALVESNKNKNRDINVLPLDAHRVMLTGLTPGHTRYINAVFCDGYQLRRGFIVTQIPLAETEPDFWDMLMERSSSVVVCFNDCQEEAVYWPAEEGEQVTSGQTTIQCVHKSLEASGCVTRELVCQKGNNKHDVLLMEVKMSKKELPTTSSLLYLCSELERYATSGNDVITVQDRNGSRLSGIFVVALNLFLRARIEQEVDIVLEVKLARRSRPQFISDYRSFELLHEFLLAYLEEFSDYSNFK